MERGWAKSMSEPTSVRRTTCTVFGCRVARRVCAVAVDGDFSDGKYTSSTQVHDVAVLNILLHKPTFFSILAHCDDAILSLTICL